MKNHVLKTKAQTPQAAGGVVQACYPGTQEVDEDYFKSQASGGHTVRPNLKDTEVSWRGVSVLKVLAILAECLVQCQHPRDSRRF